MIANEYGLLYSIYELIIFSFLVCSNIFLFDPNPKIVIDISLYIFTINNIIILSYNIYHYNIYHYNIYNNILPHIIILFFIVYYYIFIKSNNSIISYNLIRILFVGEFTNIIKNIKHICFHSNYVELYNKLIIFYTISNIFIKLLISIIFITLLLINNDFIINIIPVQIIVLLYIIDIIHNLIYKINFYEIQNVKDRRSKKYLI